jgi:endonuclease III
LVFEVSEASLWFCEAKRASTTFLDLRKRKSASPICPTNLIFNIQAFRFQTLVALMLSSQTKDPVTAQAMKNIQAWCDSNSRAFDVDTILGMTDTQ